MIKKVLIFEDDGYYIGKSGGSWFVFGLDIPKNMTIEEYVIWYDTHVVYGQHLDGCGLPQRFTFPYLHDIEKLDFEPFLNNDQITAEERENVLHLLSWGSKDIWRRIIDGFKDVETGAAYQYSIKMRDVVVEYVKEKREAVQS